MGIFDSVRPKTNPNSPPVSKDAPNYCFLDQLTNECKEELIKNVKGIFFEAGLGKFLGESDSKENSFVELLTSDVEYENSSVTAQMVLDEIDHALLFYDNQAILKSQEHKKNEIKQNLQK